MSIDFILSSDLFDVTNCKQFKVKASFKKNWPPYIGNWTPLFECGLCALNIFLFWRFFEWLKETKLLASSQYQINHSDQHTSMLFAAGVQAMSTWLDRRAGGNWVERRDGSALVKPCLNMGFMLNMGSRHAYVLSIPISI